MEKSNREKYQILGLAVLSALLIIAIYAIMMIGKDGYIYIGHDMMFHKARLDGLYHAFQNGVWFPKINFLNVDGSGYASSIFYNELLLYPTVLMRFLGADSYTSYQSAMFLWNVLTFVFSYYSMKPIIEDKRKRVLFSFLYVLSPYRIFDIFIRGALGEVIALAFLPVALNGLYQIIYGKHKKWWMLTLGMLGIVHSHLLTTFLFSIMILLFVLIEWKEVFKVKERFIALTKATILTIGCSLWYLLPMFEQLSFQELKVEGSPRYMVGDGTESLIQAVFGNIMGSPTGSFLGVLALIVMVGYVTHRENVTSRFFRVSTDVSVILFISTTTVIPWKLLESSPLNAIQFPWRMYLAINLLTIMLFSSGEVKVLKGKISKIILVLSTLYSVTIYFTSFYILDAVSDENDKFYTREEFNEEVKDIGAGKEYLPINFDYDYYVPNLAVPDFDRSNGEVTSFVRDYGEVTLDFSFDTPTEVTIPLTIYKGYEAYINNNPVPILESSKHQGRVAVLLDGDGTLTVQYVNTTVQNLSAMVSSMFLIGFCWSALKESGVEIPNEIRKKTSNLPETT